VNGSRGLNDAASQRRFRNDPVAPHRTDEIILADNAVAVFQQINQKVEHLRLNVDQGFGIPEFAPLEVNLVFCETKNHPWSRDIEAEDGRSKPQQLCISGWDGFKIAEKQGFSGTSQVLLENKS